MITAASEHPTGVGINPVGYRLPARARVATVRLAVSDLGRSERFYTDVIGLAVLGRETRLVQLGVQGSTGVLLELEQLPGIQLIGRRARLGLYHTAFLLPSREALGSFVQHLQQKGVPFGAGDHLYSEALYLTDPDGLSVEVYADRPRQQWRVEGREIVSATETVQFHTLPKVQPGSWEGAPAGTTMGHVHFYVGDLDQARRFYHTGLGLDIMTWRYPGALFMSAGGYHHHVGLNVWAAGSPAAGPEDARLLYWELRLPTVADMEEAASSLARNGYNVSAPQPNIRSITDPWGIVVRIAPEL